MLQIVARLRRSIVLVLFLQVLLFSIHAQELPDDRLRNRLQPLKYSAAKIIFGLEGSCSGSFISSTFKDPETLFFLTAAHCVPNNISDVFLQLGNDQIMDAAPMIKGVSDFFKINPEIVAKNQSLDFALLRIPIPRQIKGAIYELGWNSQMILPPYGLLFHFPDREQLTYSIKRNELSIGTYPGDFIITDPLKNGFLSLRKGFSEFLTSPGSSGAALINPSGELLGPLTGVSFTSRDTINYFSRFDLLYNNFESFDEQLAIWIDPDQIGKATGKFKDFSKYDNYLYHQELFQFKKLKNNQAVIIDPKITVSGTALGIYLPIANLANNNRGEIIVTHQNLERSQVLLSIPISSLSLLRENYFAFTNELQVDENSLFRLSVTAAFPDFEMEVIELKTDENNLDSDGAFVASSLRLLTQLEEMVFEDDYTLTAFPNPTSTYTYLSPVNKIAGLTVQDNMGRQVNLNSVSINGELILDFRQQSKGIYILMIQLVDDQVLTKKIIRQ